MAETATMDPLFNMLLFEVIDALIEPEFYVTVNPFLWIAILLLTHPETTKIKSECYERNVCRAK